MPWQELGISVWSPGRRAVAGACLAPARDNRWGATLNIWAGATFRRFSEKGTSDGAQGETTLSSALLLALGRFAAATSQQLWCSLVYVSDRKRANREPEKALAKGPVADMWEHHDAVQVFHVKRVPDIRQVVSCGLRCIERGVGDCADPDAGNGR
jgi:hypothetical protein